MNSNSSQSNSYVNGREYDHVSTKNFPARVQFILQLLQKLDHGVLIMTFPDGQTATYGKVTDERARPVMMTLKNWDVFNAALKSGDIGFAETFIDGHWSTDNLPGLIELFIRNRQVIESVIYGTWWGNFLYRIKHLFNRNSKTGSRKNIHAHYDIGNDFYQLWLDPSMTYSSALFSDEHVENLQQGQDAKYRRILNQLRLPDNARLLEIGCGWGHLRRSPCARPMRTWWDLLYPQNNCTLRINDCKMLAWLTGLSCYCRTTAMWQANLTP